ncbi:hypothetical protein AGMMS49992_32920 [Clostridia bacterium]|nr:hypothetical protein AGMMS49992_32920 [Clostridia bacterium]
MNLIQEDNDTLKRYGLNTNDFYFCIGSRSPNKNIKWVIKLAQAMQNDIFVVAGANEKIFSSENIDNHAKNVRFIGYTTDEETKALMSNCKAFLFPSIYEGFGMPPLEAMGSGCTSVYVSDIQVMHEIYSNFVSYIDLHVCSLPSVNASTGNIALLEKYSWKSSAKILLDCFHE